MLSRPHRITRQQFPVILQASRSWTGPYLSLRTTNRRSKDGQKTAQFAFVVSRKVAINATDRNWLKRRARAVVRELLPGVKDNYSCLLFFKKEALKLSYQKLKTAIQEMLLRSSVI